MPPSETVPDRPTPGSDEAILNLVREQLEHTNRYHAPLYSKVQGWYNSYRAVYTGQLTPNTNNIALPYIYSAVWSDVAQKVNSLFGASPVITFQGYDPANKGIAKKNEVLVTAQMDDCQTFAKAVDFLSQADLNGTGLARVGWTRTERWRRFRQSTQGGPQIGLQKVVDFDGPDWQVVDILDFKPQPGKKRISDMAYIFHEYYADYDDLVDMNTGQTSQGLQPIYNPAALARLKDVPLSGETMDTYRARSGMYRNYNQYQARREETYAKPVKITERWGLVPSEFAINGARFVVYTIGNDREVLRKDEMPLWHGKMPFIACSPTPDPYYFFGIGKAQLAEPLQAAAARMMNTKLDALDRFIHPMFFGDVDKIPSTDNLFTKSGRIFPTEGDPRAAIMPLEVNMQGISAAMGEIQMLNDFIQRATGITDDTVQGLNTGDRETARGALMRHERSMTRLGMESMIVGKEFVEPLANMFRDLNRQFLTVPKEVRILGGMAEINPITGLPYPETAQHITPEDLMPDYQARAVGPMMLMTEGQQRQDAMQLAQIMVANPVWAQSLGWVAFAKKIFTIFKWDYSEFLPNTVPALNAAASAGTTPEKVLEAADSMLGGAGGQMLPPVNGEQINPQIAAMLGGGA